MDVRISIGISIGLSIGINIGVGIGVSIGIGIHSVGRVLIVWQAEITHDTVFLRLFIDVAFVISTQVRGLPVRGAALALSIQFANCCPRAGMTG